MFKCDKGKEVRLLCCVLRKANLQAEEVYTHFISSQATFCEGLFRTTSGAPAHDWWRCPCAPLGRAGSPWGYLPRTSPNSASSLYSDTNTTKKCSLEASTGVGAVPREDPVVAWIGVNLEIGPTDTKDQ